MIIGSSETPVPFDDYKRYATVRYRMLNYDLDSSGAVISTYIDYPPVSCGELQAKGMLDPDYQKNGGIGDFLSVSAICFDTSDQDTSIFGSYSDYPAKYMALSVSPCSLDDLSQCVSIEELTKSYAQVIRLEPEVNLIKKHNPVGHLANSDDYYPLNPAASGEIQEKLIIKEIVDSAGFMFPKTSVANYTDIQYSRYYNKYRDVNSLSCTKADITNSICESYLTFFMLTTNQRTVTHRKYKGLLETIGELGGLREMVFLAFFVVYQHYHSSICKFELVRRVYGLEGKRACLGSLLKNMKVSDLKAGQDFKLKENSVQVSDKVVNRAWDQIERSLDVVHISRELSSLKLLLVILCNEQTRLLMPTIMCLSSNRIKHCDNHDGQLFTSELKKYKSGQSGPPMCFGNELNSSSKIPSTHQPGRHPSPQPPTNLANYTDWGYQLSHLIAALTDELFAKGKLPDISMSIRENEAHTPQIDRDDMLDHRKDRLDSNADKSDFMLNDTPHDNWMPKR